MFIYLPYYINNFDVSGPVTNAFFITLPRDLQNEERKPRLLVNVFKRVFGDNDEEESRCITTMITGNQKLSLVSNFRKSIIILHLKIKVDVHGYA